MKNPKRKLLGKTWVGWFNYIIAQWFFVRIAYGDKWRLLKWVKPLSGWNNNFIYIKRKSNG